MTRAEAIEAVESGIKLYANGYGVFEISRERAEQRAAIRLLLICYYEVDDRRRRGARVLLDAVDYLRETGPGAER